MVEPIGPKEEHILNIAMQVFVEKGWHGTKMQEIADRAGVNKAMLHYYFRSKERLYSTIFRQLFMKYMSSLSDSFQPEQDFASTLKQFINRFLDMLRDNPQLPMFVARELSEGGAIVQQCIRELVQDGKLQTPHKFIAEIKKAEARGEIEPMEEPVHFLFTLIGSCVYFFLAGPIIKPLFPGILSDSDDFLEKRKEAIFKHLYFGIKKRGDNT